MFKFLLIVCVIGYVFYKIGSFFFRAGAASQHFRNFQQHQRNPNINATASKKPTGRKGGEYVDYEEVK